MARAMQPFLYIFLLCQLGYSYLDKLEGIQYKTLGYLWYGIAN